MYVRASVELADACAGTARSHDFIGPFSLRSEVEIVDVSTTTVNNGGGSVRPEENCLKLCDKSELICFNI
jgi:hypothetical protein